MASWGIYLKLAKKLNERLHYVATDGVDRIIRSNIDNMNDEEYKLFVKYHLSICEREDLIGYSGHILSIVEKNE